MTSRRAFLLGLTGALAAPAIVRAYSLMKIVVLRESLIPFKFSTSLTFPLLLENRLVYVIWDRSEDFSMWTMH